MKLQKEPFEMIKSGRKIYEMRLLDEKRKMVKIGDEIEFSRYDKEDEKLIVVVEELINFPSFIDLYAHLSPLDIGYTEENKDSASYSDMEKYYSKEEQQKYGVVAIKIKLI